VSTSKYDRLHFKHQRNAEPCILKDENLSPAELEQFTQILKAKESDRHKHLKNLIAGRLHNVSGVDPSSISADDRFIIRGSEKRRPDVYCRYLDKELVFEIQLSQLSLRYIISRYEFYRQHGIYLIWILDNFDVRDQSQLERDIKYLTHHQNFFKLDESVSSFKLACEYKSPFLTPGNQIHSKWLKHCVSLDEVQFDEKEYQIFYYDFQAALQRQQETKRIRDLELDEIEWRRVERLHQQQIEQQKAIRQSEIRQKTGEVISELQRLRKCKSQVFISAAQMLLSLDEEERSHFNSQLGLSSPDGTGDPKFFHWIHSAKQEDVAFLEFVFVCPYIRFDINAKGKDNASAFQAIYKNNNIGKYSSVKALFEGGYNFTEDDEILIRSLKVDEELEGDLVIYHYCTNLELRSLVGPVFSQKRLICILHSARQGRIVGFKYQPSEWVAFANNAIQYYGTYWEYIELVFKHYSLWEKIIAADKKGTFQKKLQNLYTEMPQQSFDFDRIFRALFPEFDNSQNKMPLIL
ncbi:MAG TPA: DUF6035 family protein, partial [Cyclobacteriaceae bacterium]|nr:DUF6035 family protein [Cyclobacteriaceae bacterium]